MVNNLNTGETNMETNLFFRQAVDDTKTVYLNLGGGGILIGIFKRFPLLTNI